MLVGVTWMKTYCIRVGSCVDNDRGRKCAAFEPRDRSCTVSYCGACRWSGTVRSDGRPDDVTRERASAMRPTRPMDFWGMSP